jgi:hypothetical protein
MVMRKIEIKVKGHINKEWTDWFDKLTITHSPSGVSIMAGPVRDQAELRGILGQLADLGIELISVTTGPENQDEFSSKGGDT